MTNSPLVWTLIFSSSIQDGREGGERTRGDACIHTNIPTHKDPSTLDTLDKLTWQDSNCSVRIYACSYIYRNIDHGLATIMNKQSYYQTTMSEYVSIAL